MRCYIIYVPTLRYCTWYVLCYFLGAYSWTKPTEAAFVAKSNILLAHSLIVSLALSELNKKSQKKYIKKMMM